MEREVLGSCLGMKLEVILGRDSNSSESSGGRRARLIVGLMSIWESNLPAPVIGPVGIEVIEHGQDPAISTREVLDAISLVWGDLRCSVPAESLRHPHAHIEKPARVVLSEAGPVCWD